MDKPLSISALNQLAHTTLESSLGVVFVAGEISNLSQPSSGHCYFTLKDAKAQVRCALFKRYKQAGTSLQNGLQVLVRAKVAIYQARGDYQLIIHHVEEDGIGELQRAYDLLKKTLLAEGLFESNHKKPLPHLPQCIGIITSPTGAAIQDILTVLERRFPSIPVIIYPSLVQGKEAAKNIVEMLRTANAEKRCDVLILSRGGGSLEDLWPFNERIVAEAVFASALPIITGVGHEVDTCIVDFVSDYRAPTPSAAAECAVPDQKDYLQKIAMLRQRASQYMTQYIAQLKLLVRHLNKRLIHPGQKISDTMQELDRLESHFNRAIQHRLTQEKNHQKALINQLNLLNPLNILNRGYSILFDENACVVRSKDSVTIGDTITAKLADGNITLQVK